MATFFGEDGLAVAVTALEVGPCFVTQIKTVENDGYQAIQLGFGDGAKLNSPEKGHLKPVQHYLKYLREFRADDDLSAVQVGQKVDVSMFAPGDLVDVIGISKGKGFAGGMKRHNFRGGPKTHGQSDRGRAPGSIGGTTYPGRVFKGTRMAGHMGSERVTVKNLKVIKVEPESSLLFVRGGVVGAVGQLVLVKKSRVR